MSADRSGLPDEAWDLLTEWLPPNDSPERPQITLSTVDAAGEPDARTVLLSEFDADGFFFNTDAASRKAADILTHAAVALTVLWPGFTRQLVVRGIAEMASAGRIAAQYAARSPYLQQLAWQNTHEFASLALDVRRQRWADFTAAHPDGFDQPPTWTGFLVRPRRLTFWTSNPDTASRRVEWQLGPGGWSRRYLAG